MAQKRIIVGLAAHVDAGKTTLSEAMLYTAGRIRRVGRVDHGDAYLDTDPIEKERGITIFSKQAELEWKKRPITLVDTPGHADFSGVGERALGIVDLAVLVISGTDGPQSHTLTLWRILERLSCPVVLFVNKCDQQGADQKNVLLRLREKLSISAVAMNEENTQDEIAMCDEGALDYYLRTGSVPDFKVNQLIRERKLFPVLFGSALKIEGVEPLLDLIRQFEDGRAYPSDFSARVYKIARDPQGARLTFIKVTGGELHVRDLLSYADVSEKAAELRFYSGVRYRCQELCTAGEICAVAGLSKTEAGEILGSGKDQNETGRMVEPYYTCRLILQPGQDIHRVLDCLRL
ncbi:MAG: GTP-binding protein, partial [Clostridia bacterium]|nr:GTP-binding protein [Clostridia bacterium]